MTLQTPVPWTAMEYWRKTIDSGHLNGLLSSFEGTSTIKKIDRIEAYYNRAVSFRKPSADRENIWSLLVTSAQRRAKVPKDHVFAVLGLMDADTQKLVDVDHSKTDAQVFQEIVLIAMKTSTAAQKLPALWESMSWVPTITPGLPSWVPDLSNETNAPVGDADRLILSGLSKAVSYAFFDAAQLRLSPENGLISLQALEMDTVSIPCGDACPVYTLNRVSDLYYDAVRLSSAATTLFWIRCLCETLSGSEASLPAMARLTQYLVENTTISIGCLEFMVGFAKDLQNSEDPNLDSNSRATLGPRPDHELYRRSLVELSADPATDGLSNDLMSSIIKLNVEMGGTYVFATSGGRLGRSAKPVSPGDRICLVPGGRLFHIFSDTSPSRYITCAAVHGLMGDDLPDLVRELGREWEDITIY